MIGDVRYDGGEVCRDRSAEVVSSRRDVIEFAEAASSDVLVAVPSAVIALCELADCLAFSSAGRVPSSRL